MSALLQALKDPFASDYPSFLEQVVVPPGVYGAEAAVEEPRPLKKPRTEAKSKGPTILREVAQCCAFSARGSYLLVGSLVTGRVYVRDMVTRQPVATRICHSSMVTSVAYLPRHASRLVLSTSIDGTVKVHDLEGFACKFAAVFEQPVAGASASPAFGSQGNLQCLVSLAAPAKRDGAKGSASPSKGDEGSWPWPVVFDLAVGSAGEIPRAQLAGLRELRWERSDKEAKLKPKAIVATFSADGSMVLVGGANGAVHVFDAATGAHGACHSPVVRKGFVQRLVLSKSGRVLLMQVTDKVIHMLDWDGAALSHKLDLQDSVEGTRWSSCALSPDAEYVIGACSKTHTLHVWNVLGRHMAKLPSPIHGLVRDLVWHPCRPLVVSLSYDGHLLLWSTHRSESWSAFAPNFVQLEENAEYHEREDEFDKNPRAGDRATGRSGGAGRPSNEIAVEVDVVSLDHEDPALAEHAIRFNADDALDLIPLT